MKPGRVVVVGGGVAGLVAAISLAEAGAEVVLLEAEPTLGGRFATPERRTIRYGDVVLELPMEHGIHGVWSQYRSFEHLLRELGTIGHLQPAGTQELIFARSGGYTEIGESVRTTRLPMPFIQPVLMRSRAFREGIWQDGPVAALRAARDMLPLLAIDPVGGGALLDRYTVEDLVGRWPTAMQGFFGALTHAGFFGRRDRVSLAAFAAGLAYYVLERHDAASFRFLAEDTEASFFGPGAARIRAAGGSVRTSTPAAEVVLREGRACGVRLADGAVLPADAVVLAVDPPALRALGEQGGLHAALGAPVVPAGWGSVIARLFFTRPIDDGRAPSGVVGDGVFDGFFWLDRVHREYARWRERTGGGVVELHLYADRGETEEPEEDLLRRLAHEVGRLWPEVDGTFAFGLVQRNPAKHVAFECGAWSSVPCVATPMANVALAGDWVRPPWLCLYLERATVTGLQAARQVAPALGVRRDAMLAPIPPNPPEVGVRALRRLSIALGMPPSLG